MSPRKQEQIKVNDIQLYVGIAFIKLAYDSASQDLSILFH